MLKKPLVFDSWAILALIQEEAAAGKIESLLIEAEKLDVSRAMTVVNLGVVWYSVARRRSAGQADSLVQQVKRAGIEVVDVDWDLVRQAAEFKSRYKLPYADAFAAALAKSRKAELITGDRDFKLLQGEVNIHWL